MENNVFDKLGSRKTRILYNFVYVNKYNIRYELRVLIIQFNFMLKKKLHGKFGNMVSLYK